MALGVGIALTLVLLISAIKAAMAVLRQSDAFNKFGQSKLVALLALMAPLVPILLIVMPAQIGSGLSFTLCIAIALFLFIVPRKQKENFEIKGRDQVTMAIEATEKVQVLSIICFIYIALNGLSIFLVSGLSGNGF